MNAKRILLVTSEFPPQPGGIGQHAYHLGKYLDSEAYPVEVITDQRSVTGEEECNFDDLLSFNVYRIPLRQFRWRMYFKRISVLFRQIKTVEIVIASGKFSLWIVAFLSLFYKRRYFAVIHGSEVNFTSYGLKMAIQLSLKRFDTLIAVSNYTKALVAHLHPTIVVIPNGIDLELLDSGQAQKRTIAGQPKLLTVGNVTERKGQLNVIKHLPELLKVYPKLHYHCVGLPTQKDEFIKKAHILNVEKHVTFHGRVTLEDLHSFLTSSDVFVMLSQSTQTGDVEGFGIALLEANYFGLPCIGSKGCGIEDAIDDFKTGRLIRPTQIDEFKAALDSILRHYDAYQQHANAWALEHSWHIIVKRYIKELGL